MGKICNLKKYIPDIVNSFLVLLFGFITYLYFEGLNWVGYQTGQPLSNLNFFIESAVLLVYDGGLLFYSFKYYKVKVRWPFFFVLVTACFFAMVPLLWFPGATFEGRVVYSIGAGFLWRYLLLTFMVFLSIFIFVFVVPQLITNRNFYRLFIGIVVLVGLVATIYSYIHEREIYVSLFTDPHAYRNVPQSYTTNRNVYAYICIMAMLCDACLLVEKDRPWRWVLFFYFFVNACFTFSKTCILLGVFIVVAFSIYKIIKMWPNRKLQAIALMSGLLLSVLFYWVVSLNDFGGILGKLHLYTNYLFFELPKTNDGSLESRRYFFMVANEVLSHSSFTRIFGFGYGNWYAAYYASFTGDSLRYQPMDIAYAVDMLEFGFPGLAFSIALWGLAIYLVIMQFVNKSKYSFINALMLACFLLRTATEAGDFTNPNLTGVAYYLVLLCPMMAENKAVLPKKTESVEGKYRKNPFVLSRLLSSVVTSALTVLSVLFLCLSFRMNGFPSLFLFICSIVTMIGGALFSVGFIFLLVRKKTLSAKTNGKAFIESLLSTLFCVACWAFSSIVLKGNAGSLDGMTHLMVCLFSAIVMIVVNGIILMESFSYEEKAELKESE